MGRTSDAREKLLCVAFDLIHEHSYGTVGVEQICTRAGVNKGSFYYFFKTKADLVVAAYEEHWRLKNLDYARIFSPQHAPLKRLALWCDYIRSVQKQRHKKYGHVCGCPFTSVGGEMATQDKKIRLKTRELMTAMSSISPGPSRTPRPRAWRRLATRRSRRNCAFLCRRAFVARQDLQRFENFTSC